MGLEEVNGLKGARKERKSKPWAVYEPRKRNNVIEPRKLETFSKSPW